jgi:hypothetical protein
MKDTDSLDDELRKIILSWVIQDLDISEDKILNEAIAQIKSAVLQTVLELQELVWVKRGDVESHENIINANKVKDLIHRIRDDSS